MLRAFFSRLLDAIDPPPIRHADGEHVAGETEYPAFSDGFDPLADRAPVQQDAPPITASAAEPVDLNPGLADVELVPVE